VVVVLGVSGGGDIGSIVGVGGSGACMGVMGRWRGRGRGWLLGRGREEDRKRRAGGAGKGVDTWRMEGERG